MKYPFGSGLVQFIKARGLITLISDLNGTVRVKKKKGAYYLPNHLYAVCNFDLSLLSIKLNLPMNIKRARYEQLIIKQAIAYDGYHFYLPAFLDFQGRIFYRGVLHFHERDLVRSLIVFADSKYMDNININEMDNIKKLDNINQKTLLAAAAFHYRSFVSVDDALEWFTNNLLQIFENHFVFSQEAKCPFQRLRKCISDLISYFLLDETLAKRTNLIPSSNGKILDVYSFILKELKKFMKAELENNLSTIVCNLLTRNIVKVLEDEISRLGMPDPVDLPYRLDCVSYGWPRFL
ncbi:hypothetical protein JRO89_XS03G0063100 [Xanthoceras sorbifolium]|uniref:DNA-directed RNA polymerase n=1 Tax=Xanthoceras sorbifolium TaxID=99658 RepID=A0ABQ8I9V1_9ROSI|nr:hypothetical protein JRO89_XS03G0063100 [Xanthoceras sorbifolium]